MAGRALARPRQCIASAWREERKQALHAVNILPAMPEPAVRAARSIDPVALVAVLSRLARAGQAPWLHGEVARRMAERLPVIRLQPEHIVDWWSFLGGGAARLAEAYPQARLTAIEPTAALLTRSVAALRTPWWSARRWRGSAAQAMREDEAPATGAPPVQLLWSNMALHAAADPPAVIQRWHELLAPQGFAMFSCFGPDTVRELRTLYAPTGRPPGIDFVDMHDLGDMMVRAGFADPVMDQETITLEWPTPAALLHELRSLGGNVSVGRPPGLHGRRWQAALLRELESLRGTNGRLAMRFEIAYGHAFKAIPRLPVASETRVSAVQMRDMARAERAKR